MTPAADNSAPLGGGGRAAYLAILREVLIAGLNHLDELEAEWRANQIWQDRRQPGGVPGAHPASAALTVEDSTLAPAYRAPLEGTLPPAGRRFMCGSCARSFEGHVMAGCPCGGEIIIVDPGEGEPVPELPDEPEHRQVRASWQYGIHAPTLEQGTWGEIECSCGVILTDKYEARLLERWDAHAAVEGS